MSEEDLFSSMLGDDVTPIKTEKRVTLKKDSQDEESLDRRRQSAENEQAVEEDPLSSAPMEMLEPMSLLEFKRPGVQNGVYRNMRLGKYNIDARLDLHRMKVEEARKSVFQFVKDCVSHDVRMALITHGKGEGRATPAMLKSCVAHWLPQIEDVLAFHTAQKQHGGYGATYLLIKKSEKKKDETRRKLGRKDS